MPDNEILQMLDQLFLQTKMRRGSAVRSRWFYDRDGCPGCGKKISTMNFKGQRALSLNVFIFREHFVLIGYLLCGKCAKFIFKESETNPNVQTKIHDEIEKSLRAAYIKRMGH